ncbi:PREDICTED: 6-pyruvoyl tetrahydrobiopterin synthase [Nicrophorus vespilloides]|uniref:6-pyruvoyl tetrahydrobiopterin synthase n=1 Tax=Nicrophorus vespilloides TaxID=110193 RepID=A0ABM1MY88_NICVS|nr:PREDICTED: 6-pyruvoyl tetrahydrobiopterin synthase [Nicrophorus vespilloides]
MSSMPKAYLTRRIQLSACHRLHSTSLTVEENARVYGKCNNINGHGHNYIVEVTLFGEVDQRTGMVMNLTDLKAEMETAIMDVADHKNLDKDVAYFKDVPSTTENVAIFFWCNLKQTMKKPSLLYEIKIHETENNIVIYRGD